MKQKIIRQASVCTGLGAAELAGRQLGWENVFMSEIDEFCCKVLKYHFPNTELHGDFTKEDYKRFRGLIDVFTAGFPCQPFSVSGDRRGADDHRYLWPQVFRLIEEFRPPWFIGENVAGITSMVFPGDEVEVESQSDLFGASDKETILREQYILESICKDLERIGYSVRPFIIPACAEGAPHRRDRIWIVANDTNTGAESVQFGWENGIHGPTFTSDSQCDGGNEIHNQVQPEQSKRNGINSVGLKWNVANTGGVQFQNRTSEHNAQDQPENKTGLDNRTERPCNIRYASYANKFNGNLSRFRTSEISQLKASRVWKDNWRDFPTQSPICSRNDGLSGRLDGITFSKWRAESIKAYGNAIVPQVLLEIFKIINDIENET